MQPRKVTRSLAIEQHPTLTTPFPAKYSDERERRNSGSSSVPAAAAAEEEAGAVADNSTLLSIMIPAPETPANMLSLTCDV